MEAVYIVSAAFINTVFNGLWATFIQCRWRKLWSVPDRVKKNSGPMPYLISFIGSLWASYGIFLMIKYIKPDSLQQLLIMAAGSWLFILIAMSAKYYAFEGRRMIELLIDYSQDFISFILISYVLWLY